jgi:predicted RNA-binding protein with PUA-like domain
MAFWLLKSEPETYSWDDLQREKIGTWDGVRNHSAKLNLMAMRAGDLAFFYHSVSEKAVVGIVKIVKEAFPDPTAHSGQPWVAVRVQPWTTLSRPVTLRELRSDPRLEGLMLLTHTRLSVMPLSEAHFDTILARSQQTESSQGPSPL